MIAKIILVQPEYEENIGLIARAMQNFGFQELLLVKPKTRILTAKSKSRAMKGISILEKAKKFSTLEKALEQVDFSIATTAKKAEEKRIFRTAITPKALAKRFSETSAVLGIVFGREGTGLRNEEIRQCDFVLSIPASNAYLTLNISHSVAIILYELFCLQKQAKKTTASKKTMNTLLQKIKNLVECSETIQNRQSVMLSFKALIGRSAVTEKEVKALLALFAGLEQQINK